MNVFITSLRIDVSNDDDELMFKYVVELTGRSRACSVYCVDRTFEYVCEDAYTNTPPSVGRGTKENF